MNIKLLFCTKYITERSSVGDKVTIYISMYWNDQLLLKGQTFLLEDKIWPTGVEIYCFHCDIVIDMFVFLKYTRTCHCWVLANVEKKSGFKSFKKFQLFHTLSCIGLNLRLIMINNNERFSKGNLHPETGLNFTVAPVDVSSASPSAAEGGQALSAVWGLVHTLLDKQTHRRNPNTVGRAVDIWQCFHGPQGAGTDGGSRGVRRPLCSDCRQARRGDGSAEERPRRNPELQGESPWVFVLFSPHVESFPWVSSPQSTGRVGVSARSEKNPRNLPPVFSSLQASWTAAVRRNIGIGFKYC